MGKKSILVVEDDEIIRANLTEVFEGDGFVVLAAENGQVAINILREAKELPGVIFLDINMPVMDGQEFLIEIQKKPENEKFHQIPVVIVSAARHEIFGDVVAYVRKPPQLDQLIDLAEKYSGAGAAVN